MRDLMLALRVWAMAPLRVLDGFVFLFEDLRFFCCDRARIRERVRQLMTDHGVLTRATNQGIKSAAHPEALRLAAAARVPD